MVSYLSGKYSINMHINAEAVRGSCIEEGHIKQIWGHLHYCHLLVEMR